MIEPGLPENEAERLSALRAYEVLDTDPESAFDDLTRIAATACGTPLALVSLVDAARQWFKSRVGTDARETPRNVAFCGHAILDPESVLLVPDAHADPRFSDNPLVVDEPHVRFYAGAPLVTPDGFALGTLCVIDHQPRELDETEVELLRVLARQVVSQLELRKKCRELGGLAEKLHHANRELQDFTSIAAHDLQEPLRKVVAFSQLLRKDLGEDLPERAEKDVQFVTDAALRMQTLITDLLHLSRAGTSELAWNRVPLVECVDRALDALATRIEETGARIEVDELPFVHGDRTLLTQLFQNLIGNALKFVQDAVPEVHVGWQSVDGEIVLGVRDNGIGIDPQYAETVFSPFKRLHGRGEYTGTGIGLAITRKVVDRHGGRIWVESKPGAGSHFRFTLGRTESPSVRRCALGEPV